MMMMLVYIYKSRLQALTAKHLDLHILKNLCLKTPIFRNYRTKTTTPTNAESSEFKISFLQNEYGLSKKSLIRASECLSFDFSDQRAHSVLQLFRTFGFPRPNINKIISKYPGILKGYHPEMLIKPKLEFLLSMDLSRAEVIAIVTKCPPILHRSLNNRIKPTFNLLSSLIGSRDTLVLLKHNPHILTAYRIQDLSFNFEFLCELGVPRFQIVKYLAGPFPVLGKPHDKLRSVALKVKGMGFDLSSGYFFDAVVALCHVTDSTWEARCVLFRSFGFSNHEIDLMLRKLPRIMCYSEKKISESVQFVVNKLQWTPSRLSCHPAILSYSLQKRTIPRCSVLQVLVSKNITRESYRLSTILSLTQRKFLMEYVNAHMDKVPEVMEAYQGKLRFDEYTFKQKGQ
ncbi:transcription termination factor MTERF2, chloroplastic [Daucus carota subsp. sativus]|nr:PREDICTED: transcription termination factor MTERF2, chloroplastic-like [Daucus carota subsp. sativus]